MSKCRSQGPIRGLWFRGFEKLPKKRLCTRPILSFLFLVGLFPFCCSQNEPGSSPLMVHDYFLVFLSLPSCRSCKHKKGAAAPLLRWSKRRLPNSAHRRRLCNRDCQQYQQAAPLEALLLGHAEWILGARPNSWRAHLQSTHKAQVRWGKGSEDLWVPCMSQTEMLWLIGICCSSLLCGTLLFHPNCCRQMLTSAFLLKLPWKAPQKQRII